MSGFGCRVSGVRSFALGCGLVWSSGNLGLRICRFRFQELNVLRGKALGLALTLLPRRNGGHEEGRNANMNLQLADDSK